MYLKEFLTIALIHFFAIASPGPDLLVVVRTSAVAGKQAGMLTALGVGVAILIHVMISLLGLGALLLESHKTFLIFKLIAAFYLIYLGAVIINSTHDSMLYKKENELISIKKISAFKAGFLTSLLNPKVTVFFISIFTLVVSQNTPLTIQALYGLYLCGMTIVWFCLICILFETPSIRSFYLRNLRWLDRLLGAALIGLGGILIVTQIYTYI